MMKKLIASVVMAAFAMFALPMMANAETEAPKKTVKAKKAVKKEAPTDEEGAAAPKKAPKKTVKKTPKVKKGEEE